MVIDRSATGGRWPAPPLGFDVMILHLRRHPGSAPTRHNLQIQDEVLQPSVETTLLHLPLIGT
jgi:hypothetical protein